MKNITTFLTEQLNTLRISYATLQTVQPNRLADFHKLFDACADSALKQLSGAKIKFVSPLARNAMMRRSGLL